MRSILNEIKLPLRSKYLGLRRRVPLTTMSSGQSAEKYTNKLASETSPYLLQHKHNPVNWYPWGPEAFEEAKKRDVPVLISVGYSSCHWCHVMEHESFEDASTAQIMNDKFVSIKVDREERPDVDRVYMQYVQATSGSGGWPMNVFCTPDLKPFLGGTYYPPEDRYGRPGFKTILNKVSEVWSSRRADVEQAASVAVEALRDMSGLEPAGDGGGKVIDASFASRSMAKCTADLSKRFDEVSAGFGSAPKFPRPAELQLLFAEQARLAAEGGDEKGRERALAMATRTLTEMSLGGMYDQLGGGFHRYSVDEHFHVPHFEKMLYDQPQIVKALVAAFQLTSDPLFAQTIRGTLDYMRREMRAGDGGYFSAQDADSLDKESGKKKEGAFYTWRAGDISMVLNNRVLTEAFFTRYYVKHEGNTDLSPMSDPHDEFGGLNVLIALATLEEVAKKTGILEGELETLLQACREKLYRARASRPPPGLDDKRVAGWEGMMVGALAQAARVLQGREEAAGHCWPNEGRPPLEYLLASEECASFIRDRLWDPRGRRLYRSYNQGKPSRNYGFADDYALVISGLMDLYEAGGALAWLEFAVELQSVMDGLFGDAERGGYFNTDGADPSVLVRGKEDYDGAEPAASSVAAANLLRLAQLAPGAPDGPKYHDRALSCLGFFAERLTEVPMAVPQMASVLYAATRPSGMRQVVVAGRKGEADTEALMAAAHRAYCPDRVIIHVDPSDAEATSALKALNPQAVALAVGGWEKEKKALVHICQNFTCQAPTDSAARVVELLGQAPGGKKASGPVKFDLGSLMGGKKE